LVWLYQVRQDAEKGVFSTPPVIKKEILSLPIYHYLDKKYAPFMERVTAYIKNKKPFAFIEANAERMAKEN